MTWRGKTLVDLSRAFIEFYADHTEAGIDDYSRKALRRIIVANLPVFESFGWMTPNLTMQDDDFVNGEYPAQIYQVMCTFTCVAPVRVSGDVPAISSVISRSSNG
jgi:hypothetical protein